MNLRWLSRTRRRGRLRIQQVTYSAHPYVGEWMAVLIGRWGQVIAESKSGRYDEAEQRARNYERYGAWEKS